MGDAATPLVAGVILIAFGQLLLLWHLRRPLPRTSEPPPEPTYSSDDFYQLRTQVQAIERQVQDVELTIEARHRKVCGMISGERGAALAEASDSDPVAADQIRANLAGDGSEAPVGHAPRQRLRKRR